MYRTLRTIHLLSGVFALPMLAMYGVSAVQMAHPTWFPMQPAVTQDEHALRAGLSDARRVARELMTRGVVRGDINEVRQTAAAYTLRIVRPGTVHEIQYDRANGIAKVRTSMAGVMGMLNRLHHAAGLWHDWGPLNAWGLLVGLVSFATVCLGATGIWMWWLRRQERWTGLILVLANVAFSMTVLFLLRQAGP
jgi:hypothetical protein